MQNKLLAELLSIQGNHDYEGAMVDYVQKYIKSIKGVKHEIDEHGNMIVTKQTSKRLDYFPAVACHLDTVHAIDKKYQVLYYDDMFFTPPNCKAGVGGDDRCGIFIALTLLKELPDLKVFLFTGEEVGCIGSNAIDLKIFDDCRFIIEPDRKDQFDLISTYSGQDTGGLDFMKLLDVARTNGFKDVAGVYTDVMILLDRGLEISVLNISCGYYKAHTQYEYIIQSEVIHTLETVRELILASKDTQYFNDRVEYIAPAKHDYSHYDTYYKYGNYPYNADNDEWGDAGDVFSGKPYKSYDKKINDSCDLCYTEFNHDDLQKVEGKYLCKDCVPYVKDFWSKKK
jgi:putative aminopeptidase FrvX